MERRPDNDRSRGGSKKRGGNSFLIFSHRDYPVPFSSLGNLQAELQADIMTFQSQHAHYLKSTQKVTRQVIEKLEAIVLQAYPTFKVA